MLVKLKSGICLFYSERSVISGLICSSVSMEIMALEKGHKRLILCGKKLENMVFVQGMGVYSTIFFS